MNLELSLFSLFFFFLLWTKTPQRVQDSWEMDCKFGFDFFILDLLASVCLDCELQHLYLQREQESQCVCWWNCMSQVIGQWMNYSLETFNEGSVGGRLGKRWGLVGRWKQLQLSPKRNPNPLLTAFHVCISHIHFSILLHNPHALSALVRSLPSFHTQHSPILIMDAWHSTCSVLCVAVPFYYQVKWQIHIWR